MTKTLAAARKAEKDKESKYTRAMEAYANENNHDVVKFVPFAVECFGGMGSQAERFLNTLSVYARDHLSAWSHYDVVEGLKKAIATAIQRGNGMVVIAGYNNSARAFNNSS